MTPVAIGDTQGTLQARKMCESPKTTWDTHMSLHTCIELQMAASMEASMFSMFSMFNMHVRACMRMHVRACMRMHVHACVHGTPPTHSYPPPLPSTHPPPPGGDPRNQLKFDNT